jgi:hypothetical protein
MPSEIPSPESSEEREKVDRPAKVVRLATMTAGLLDELRGNDLDELGRPAASYLRDGPG